MRVLVAMVGAFLLLAASSAAQTPQEDLDRARAQWAAAAIGDYAYSLDAGCFCRDTGPQESVVRGGVAEKGQTVEQLFDQIQREIDRKPYKIEVTYGEHGVPVRMYRDSYDGVVDDHYAFNVTDFRRLEPAPDELAAARAEWKASGIRRHAMVVTRRCEGGRASVRRDRTVPQLHRLVARSPDAVVRYGRFGIPRAIATGDCRYAVTRFRRGR